MSMIAALFASGSLAAQAGRIAGTVTSAEGNRPLAGAVVSVAGVGQRAVTRQDGGYVIANVPAGTHRVMAAVLGHAPQTQTVTVGAGAEATLNFSLASSAVAVEGLVAIGYGERRVRDVTGSVQAVSEEQFNTGRVVSPEQLIQSKVAGVQVVDNAEPGGGISIRIRGGNSITASAEPLFVVDGVPMPFGGGLSAGRNPLNFIDPNDIARITVLKDAASTAIYGSRGANGVIIIETKSGRGAPSIEYTSSVSTSVAGGEPDFLSAEQFRQVVTQHAPNRVGNLGNASTNWRQEVERDAFGQEHALAISGSTPATTYRVGLNYLNQTGVLRGSETRRVAGTVNVNTRLFNDRMTVTANLRGARTDDDFTPGGVLGSATVFDPTQAIRTPSGAFWENTQFPLGPNNPLADLAFAVDEGTTYRSLGSVEGKYRFPFLEALSTTVRLGYDVAKSERRSFLPTTLQSQVESAKPGFVSRSNPSEATGLIDVFANYNARTGPGELDATAGYSYERMHGDYPYFYADSLTSNLLGQHGIPPAGEYVERLNTSDSNLASFFGRANYTLMDRYIFTASLRRDGSSRFGPANVWGNFPAAAFGWRLSEESWFPELGWMDELKFRASWGVNGNQSIPIYAYLPTYSYGDQFAQVQFGDRWVNVIRPTSFDPSLKWEETTSTNFGLDFGLFGNRVTGTIDYYYKKTEDLLFDVTVPAGTNVQNHVVTNIGQLSNRGLEIGLNGRVLDGSRLHWDASLNVSTNKNRLIDINPNAPGSADQRRVGSIAGGVGSTIQILQPDVPVNAFLVYHHLMEDGHPVYRDTDGDNDIDNDDLYEDTNGDGKVDDSDRRPFHSPQPTWILGHTSNFGYDNFDLSFTMRAYLGNYVYNNVASSNGFYNLLNQAGGLTNLHASVLENNFVNPQFFSDIYVEDASFLRMDNITLGYSLPNFRGTRNLRVFGTVQNVFTLTGYSGVDPTAGLNGIDNNIYPRSRTFSAGLTVGF